MHLRHRPLGWREPNREEGSGFRFGRPREIGGLLVKAPKRGQERRVDLPAIGPRTFANAARAGLSAVCVAAGEVIVIDRAATLEAANRHGLALFGFAP